MPEWLAATVASYNSCQLRWGVIHCYLKLTEVPLLLGDVPLSTFVSVSSALVSSLAVTRVLTAPCRILCSRRTSSSSLLSSLELSDTQVYEPYIRARLGTAAHFCEAVTCFLVGRDACSHGTVRDFVFSSCSSCRCGAERRLRVCAVACAGVGVCSRFGVVEGLWFGGWARI